MRLLLPLLILLAAAPAAAQEPEWRAARDYDVALRSFAFEPEEIRLRAGEPVKLHFVNQGRSTLSFSAGDFFRAARIRSGADAEEAAGGRVTLAPGERRTIALVPAPGRYRARGRNLLHRLLGMSAEIVVE